MGQKYTVVAEAASIAAASGTGAPVFQIKTPSTANVAIHDIVIGGVAGAASQPQSQTFTVRVCRGATALATEGGTRMTPRGLHPNQRASTVTAIKDSNPAAGATEGGVCLFASGWVGAAGDWRWSSGGDLDKAFHCAPSSNISFLVHPTDTTVVQATITFEEGVHQVKA
jgi:hypothetical protein